MTFSPKHAQIVLNLVQVRAHRWMFVQKFIAECHHFARDRIFDLITNTSYITNFNIINFKCYFLSHIVSQKQETGGRKNVGDFDRQ